MEKERNGRDKIFFSFFLFFPITNNCAAYDLEKRDEGKGERKRRKEGCMKGVKGGRGGRRRTKKEKDFVRIDFLPKMPTCFISLHLCSSWSQVYRWVLLLMMLMLW